MIFISALAELTDLLAGSVKNNSMAQVTVLLQALQNQLNAVQQH